MQPEWTDERVRSLLVEVYLHSPSLPVRSRWVAPPLIDVGNVTFDLNWGVRFLADDPEAWAALRMWASCRATGTSVRERLLEAGLPLARSTFEIRVARAVAAITAGLNRQDGRNPASILACEHARARLKLGGRLRGRRGRVRKVLLTPGKSASDP